MLETLFLSILNMSISAGFAVLVVLAARLFLKQAPKIFSYLLWAFVLFRLVCPFSLESAAALFHVNKTPVPPDIAYSAQPEISTGLAVLDRAVNSVLPAPSHPGESANPLQVWLLAASVIWAAGIIAMMIGAVVQLSRVRRSLVGAAPLRDNIYLADHIGSPFVMGVWRPKIYLPSGLSQAEQDFIVAHESCHIRRFDYLARILWFLALALHWFNPLVWLAFLFSEKDMEMSCDEAVMKKMASDIRAEYSRSLLRFAAGKKPHAAAPLTFGAGDTRARVKNIMKYKKPAAWGSVIAIAAVICLGVQLVSSPKPEGENFNFLSAAWGDSWEAVQQKTGLEGVMGDNGQVRIENAAYLETAVDIGMVFDSEPSKTPGLHSVFVRYEEADETKLKERLKQMYGEPQQSYTDENGVEIPLQPAGWVSGNTVGSSLTEAEKEIFASQRENLDPSRRDALFRQPLVTVSIDENNNILTFSGAPAAAVRYVKSLEGTYPP